MATLTKHEEEIYWSGFLDGGAYLGIEEHVSKRNPPLKIRSGGKWWICDGTIILSPRIRLTTEDQGTALRFKSFFNLNAKVFFQGSYRLKTSSHASIIRVLGPLIPYLQNPEALAKAKLLLYFATRRLRKRKATPYIHSIPYDRTEWQMYLAVRKYTSLHKKSQKARNLVKIRGTIYSYT